MLILDERKEIRIAWLMSNFTFHKKRSSKPRCIWTESFKRYTKGGVGTDAEAELFREIVVLCKERYRETETCRDRQTDRQTETDRHRVCLCMSPFCPPECFSNCICMYILNIRLNVCLCMSPFLPPEFFSGS